MQIGGGLRVPRFFHELQGEIVGAAAESRGAWLGVALHTCNSSSREVEIGSPTAQGLPGYIVNTRPA